MKGKGWTCVIAYSCSKYKNEFRYGFCSFACYDRTHIQINVIFPLRRVGCLIGAESKTAKLVDNIENKYGRRARNARLMNWM